MINLGFSHLKTGIQDFTKDCNYQWDTGYSVLRCEILKSSHTHNPLRTRVSRVCFDGITFLCLHILLVLRRWDNLPRGRSPYKSYGNARSLVLGRKLQILISLGLFGMEGYYICPFRYRFVVCHNDKSTKNSLTLTTRKSPVGVSLSLSHIHTGLP